MSIQGPFKILVNNQAVAPVSDNGEDQIQATLGPDAAIFTLMNGRLECNGWYLSRGLIEDRSLLPKRVFWFRKGVIDGDITHRVSAEANGGSYKLWISGSYYCTGHRKMTGMYTS